MSIKERYRKKLLYVNKKLAKQLGFVEAGLWAELIFTHKQAKQENAFFEQGKKGLGFI